MSFSKTIQMYIFDGNSNGRIMCELSNWNGRVYKISRHELQEFSKRKDSEHTGVYFLFGKDERKHDTIYIGEAEKLCTRLKQHLDDESWNNCIAVLSKDNLLNKAHVKYLENKFYLLAQEAQRFIVKNNTIPTCSSISEYDEAMLQEFMSNTKLLVNTLGYKAFDTLESNSNQVNFYIRAARGANAIGVVESDGFTVRKGSTIATNTVPSFSSSLLKLREKLIEDGVIDTKFSFTKDYRFTSPSLAAAVVMGRNANGRSEWKTDDNKSLKEIEEEGF